MGLHPNFEKLIPWSETKKLGKFIKHCAIQQFLRVYQKMMLRPPDTLKFGDEIEYLLIQFSERDGTVCLLLEGDGLCENLKNQGKTRKDVAGLWTDEYGIFMIESTPTRPFEGLASLGQVEKSMKDRRREALASLPANQTIVTISSFPRLGCNDCLVDYQRFTLNGPLMNSRFLPDATVTPTLRFKAMTVNANARRGRKVSINIPVFQDQRTARTLVETYDDPDDAAASKNNCVYMDSMVFANGCCSVQVTLQTEDFEQMKIFYDQFAALSPILKALSASSPIFRGYLVNIDTRWPVISQGTDDRTVEESEDDFSDRSMSPRCSSIRSFISNKGLIYNDVPFLMDKEVKRILIDEGVDEGFASHLANTFSRDPMLMFDEKLQMDCDHDTFHFESIQSLNYQSVRFKLPPPNVDMGWRVELRACDVQLTDFENAAVVTFVVLLSRLISEEDLDFLMPISQVDENMTEADMNDAVRQGTFWWPLDRELSSDTASKRLIAKMSVNDIINGQEGKFFGLVPMIKRYLRSVDLDQATRLQIERHLALISNRASGDYLTTAQWIRHFVQTHRDYNKDSIVSASIAYDLMMACENITRGVVEDPRIRK